MQFVVVVPKRLCQKARDYLQRLGILDQTEEFLRLDDRPEAIGLPITQKIDAQTVRYDLGGCDDDKIQVIVGKCLEEHHPREIRKKKKSIPPLDEMRTRLKQVRKKVAAACSSMRGHEK